MTRSDGCRPAEQAVEIGEAGRRPGEAAVAIVGLLDHPDGAAERRDELLPAGVDPPLVGKLVEPVLGLFDLLRRRLVGRPVIGVVHHLFADGDQGAAQRQVVDGAPVVLGVDDRHGRARKPREILPAAGLLQRLVPLEEVFQGHRVGDLPALDHAEHGVVDAAVHRQEEMPRQQEGADQAGGFVVDEQGAEQRVFGFEVARRRAVARRLGCCFLEGEASRHESFYTQPTRAATLYASKILLLLIILCLFPVVNGDKPDSFVRAARWARAACGEPRSAVGQRIAGRSSSTGCG